MKFGDKQFSEKGQVHLHFETSDDLRLMLDTEYITITNTKIQATSTLLVCCENTIIYRPSPWEQSMIRRFVSLQIPVPRTYPWAWASSVVREYDNTSVFSTHFDCNKRIFSDQVNITSKEAMAQRRLSLLASLWATFAEYTWIFLTIRSWNKNLNMILTLSWETEVKEPLKFLITRKQYSICEWLMVPNGWD